MKLPQTRWNKPLPVRIGAFELTKTGFSRFDFRDPYHVSISMGWPSFFLALFMLEIAVNTLFAKLYLLQPGSISGARPGMFSDAFFFSLETLATVGYGVMSPGSFYGHAIASVETVWGLIFTALMTGLIFVRFSKPRAKFLYADNIVVTRHNNVPTLMIRVGNGRAGALTDGHAHLSALMLEETAEGKNFRRFRDLPVIRSHLPLFALTWTVMHPIDEHSPLAGFDAEKLISGDVRFVLSLEARDLALAAQVHDTKTYKAEDVLFGMRYADAVSIDADKRTVADLGRISLVEPETLAAV